MKVREILVKDFRNFTDLRRVSFVDSGTDLIRPLTVLVGSNGSGKSTMFDLMEGLLSHVIDVVEDHKVTETLREQGYAAAQLEFGSEAPTDLQAGVWVALGRKDRAPEGYRDLPNQICHLEQRGGAGKPFVRKGPRETLNRWVGEMARGAAAPHGGLLHFPHNRWIPHTQRGAIESPPQSQQWLFRFEPDAGWRGSLSQLWVWQNYLDLEQGREQRTSLTPFVDLIEKILGRGQRIMIREGHVRISRPEHGDVVEPHQLPSGEQQVLTLFGEIVRRLRPGAVILIDEVEISLHPALQRKVLHHLRTLAREKDLQFIITTHSMDIVSAVSPNEIVRMDDMVPVEMAVEPISADDE